jgi:hypothetical protein
MKLLVCLIAVVCLVASTSRAQTIASFDFSGDTPGSSPSGWSPGPNPSVPAPLNGVVVTNVSGNNAVDMYDSSGSANGRLEQDFTPSSGSLHLSLSFSRNANITPSTSTQSLYVTLGANGQSVGSSSNRAVSVRLYNDGMYRMDKGAQDGSGNFVSTSTTGTNQFEIQASPFAVHTLDIYSYSGTSGGSGFSYTGPDSVTRLLDPHSFAVYIDNVWVTSGTNTVNGNYGFQTTAWGLYSGSNLGRLAFITGGANAIIGVDFLIDNVQLSAIPEPSTFALLGAGGLLLIGLLRRSRRSR